MQYFLRAKRPAILLLFTILLNLPVSKAAAATGSVSLQYVRIEIGHGGLHCPFLGPRFEQSMKELTGIQNFKLYTRESYATFEIAGPPAVTETQLKDIAVKVGYPVADVVILISDTAPKN